jgi:hypothetical protein
MDFETFFKLYVAYEMSGTSTAKDEAFRFKAKQYLLNECYQALAAYQRQNPQLKFLRDDNPIEDVDLSQYSPSDIT